MVEERGKLTGGCITQLLQSTDLIRLDDAETLHRGNSVATKCSHERDSQPGNSNEPDSSL